MNQNDLGDDHPLVSFAVSCYKASRFIRETIEGIVAQTYRPLEIVVSDDCSPDDTWDVLLENIKRLEDEHKDIKFIANRNETNLGNFGNFEKLLSLTSGVIVIKNDGDDISCPERAERTVDAWLKDGRKADLILCDAELIDLYGKKIKGCLKPRKMFVHGAVSAYTRRCFKCFPRYGRLNVYDDQIFNNRGLMFGPPLIIPEVLVKYRQGAGLTSPGGINYRKPKIGVQRGERLAYQLLLEELEMVPIDPGRKDELSSNYKQHLYVAEAALKLYDGDTYSLRKSGLNTMKKLGCSISPIYYLLLLPRGIADLILGCWMIVRRLFKPVR